MSEICVIGAGITGLVIANELELKGYSVTLLEASERPGGVIASRSTDGFLLEYGANSTLATAELLALSDRLGLGPRIVTPSPSAKKRFIVRRNTNGALSLTSAPRGIWDFLTTPLLRPSEKLRFAGDIFAHRTTAEDESSKAFFSRHFGLAFTEQFVAAIANGIWAADISQLSARSAFPEIWELEQRYGSLLLGGLIRGIKRWRSPRPEIQGAISFQNGLRELVDALSGDLSPNAFTPQCEVLDIASAEKGVWVSYLQNGVHKKIEYERAVLTQNGAGLSQVLGTTTSEIAASAEQIPFSPIGILHLGVSTRSLRHPLDGFGFLSPPILGTTLLGCVFNSSLFPNRAPDGQHLLTCFIGGALRPEHADARDKRVQQEVFAELDQLLGLGEAPRVLDATYYPCAIPNYPLAHFKFEQQLEVYHRSNPRVRIASSSGRGIGIPARVREGLATARRINLEFPEKAIKENKAQAALGQSA